MISLYGIEHFNNLNFYCIIKPHIILHNSYLLNLIAILCKVAQTMFETQQSNAALCQRHSH